MTENQSAMMDEGMRKAAIEVAKMKASIRRDESAPDYVKSVAFDVAETAGIAHCRAISLRQDVADNLSGIVRNVGSYLAGEEPLPLPGLPSHAGREFMKGCVDVIRKTSR